MKKSRIALVFLSLTAGISACARGVKLLDFGLAKLREVDADKIGNATTMSLGLSEEGSFLRRCRTLRHSSSTASRWMRARICLRSVPCSTRW